MRRITKLSKKMARSRKDWKVKTTSGICITKLVVDHFVFVENRDDQALRETWKRIKKSLDQSTQIKHPVLEGQNLSDTGDVETEFLCDCMSGALKKLEVLDAVDCDRQRARVAWDDVFNTTYFSDQPDESQVNKYDVFFREISFF